jgi:hypothetical protein
MNRVTRSQKKQIIFFLPQIDIFHFSLLFGDLKSFDRQTIYAITWGNLAPLPSGERMREISENETSLNGGTKWVPKERFY